MQECPLNPSSQSVCSPEPNNWDVNIMSQMHELLSNWLSSTGVSCPVSLSPKKLFHQSQNICNSWATPTGKKEMNDNWLVFSITCNVRASIALTYLYLKEICLSYFKSNELLAARFRVVNEMSGCFALLIFLQFDIWCFIAFVTAGRAHFDDRLFVLFGLHGFLDYHWISQFFVSFRFWSISNAGLT